MPSISLSLNTLFTGEVGILLCFVAQTSHERLIMLGIMFRLVGEVGEWANRGRQWLGGEWGDRARCKKRKD